MNDHLWIDVSKEKGQYRPVNYPLMYIIALRRAFQWTEKTNYLLMCMPITINIHSSIPVTVTAYFTKRKRVDS